MIAREQSDAIVDGVTVTDIYWHTAHKVSRASLGGGAVSALAGGEVGAVLVRPPEILWFGSGWSSSPEGAYFDSGWHRLTNLEEEVPWMRGDHPLLMALSTSGVMFGVTSSDVLRRDGTSIASVSHVFAVAADDRYVFVRSRHDVLRVRTDVREEPLVIANQQDASGGLFADGERVYWTNPQMGVVCSYPRDGGYISVIAFAEEPRAIVTDADSVYFTTAHTIEKITPK